MVTTISLPSIISSTVTPRKMRLRSDINEPGWTFWELKNLNMHRVVGLRRAGISATDAASLDAALRAALARNFKRAWWRGIAYGVIIDVGTLTLTADDLKVLVDVYENNKGTMQWVILLAGDARHATGVHTWIEGFLSPVYRDVLQKLAENGCRISSAMRDKTGLLKFLTAVGDARAEAFTGHKAFPDFVDPFDKKN